VTHRLRAVLVVVVVVAVWAIASQLHPGPRRSTGITQRGGIAAPTAADEGHIETLPPAARAPSEDRPSNKPDRNRRSSPPASTANGTPSPRSPTQPPATPVQQPARKSSDPPAEPAAASAPATVATPAQPPAVPARFPGADSRSASAAGESGGGASREGSVDVPTDERAESAGSERRGPDANAPTAAANAGPSAASRGPATPAVSPPPSRPGPESAPTLVAPRPLTQTRPGYPEPLVTIERNGLSAAARLVPPQGRVRLRVTVRADGNVSTVDVLSSTGSAELDAAAVVALSRWRFAPATRDGVPIESYYTLWVSFRLE